MLNLLAGDLVAAGNAVGVDGEQDTHAVPGAGSDFGGRGAGGQPQRQRGMASLPASGPVTATMISQKTRTAHLVRRPAGRRIIALALLMPRSPHCCGDGMRPRALGGGVSSVNVDAYAAGNSPDRPAASTTAWRTVAGRGQCMESELGEEQAPLPRPCHPGRGAREGRPRRAPRPPPYESAIKPHVPIRGSRTDRAGGNTPQAIAAAGGNEPYRHRRTSRARTLLARAHPTR